MVELQMQLLKGVMFIAFDLIRTESEEYGLPFSFWEETEILNTILHFQISQVYIVMSG
jgi:hypothetical protein